MSKPRKKKPKIAAPEVLSAESPIERDTAIFKDWVGGMSQKEIAAKYDMSEDNVALISKKHNFRQKKQDMIARSFSKTVNVTVRQMAIKLSKLLDHDVDLIIAEAMNEKTKRKLTAEERAHARTFFDRLLKETRLEDGKPTETVSGTIETKLILPPGYKAGARFGIIPPDPAITMVETKAEDKAEELDLDKIEEDLGE